MSTLPHRRRGRAVAGWLIPGLGLILMPKCPLCVAIDVALLTGIGISAALASALRMAALILCAAFLALAAAGALRRFRFRPGCPQTRSQRRSAMGSRPSSQSM